MGTSRYSAAPRQFRQRQADSYIPPYSILHRIALPAQELSPPSHLPEVSLPTGPSSERLLDRLNSLVPPPTPSKPNSFQIREWGNTPARSDFQTSYNSSIQRRQRRRYPPQYLSFKHHSRLNNGFLRVSSSEVSRPNIFDQTVEDQEEPARSVIDEDDQTSELPVEMEGNNPSSLADRLSILPLSARLLDEEHYKVSEADESPDDSLQAPSKEPLMHVETANDGFEDEVLEEGELQEAESAITNVYHGNKILIKHLEPGTTPQDVATVFQKFGQIRRVRTCVAASLQASDDENEGIIVEYVNGVDADEAIEAMNGVMADGGIISVTLA